MKSSEQKSCLTKIISQRLMCWSFSHPLTFNILISRLMCLMRQNLGTVLFGQSSSNIVSSDLAQHPRWPQLLLVGQNIKKIFHWKEWNQIRFNNPGLCASKIVTVNYPKWSPRPIVYMLLLCVLHYLKYLIFDLTKIIFKWIRCRSKTWFLGIWLISFRNNAFMCKMMVFFVSGHGITFLVSI